MLSALVSEGLEVQQGCNAARFMAEGGLQRDGKDQQTLRSSYGELGVRFGGWCLASRKPCKKS
jgi:hypothetical protein